ncbi:XK-related protein 6-like, partial [Pollicipes pollicipes]|uniref:XK-related protein 6-like n=1 Tax=Pollicipes pollicipes TaxID=41117 RepID=UPI0018855AC1
MEIVDKKKQREEEDKRPQVTFNNWDQAFLILSIGAYIFNKIIDVVLIHTYLSSGDLTWGLLTVLIVVVPQALVHVISYRWHVHDQEATTSLLVVHCCQLGLFLRLVSQFSDGRRMRRTKSYDDSMVYLQQSSDVSMLQLFLSYLESAPQLLLQVYVTSSRDGWQLVQAVSAALSLLSLAWSNASYAKWMRKSRGDKRPLGWTAATLQLLWRLCLLLARTSALLAFSLLYSGWVLLLLAVRWLLMTGWVLAQRTDLFPTPAEERLFNTVVGAIYCFSFFNVKETPARWRMLAFYALTFAENGVLAMLFFFYWPRPGDRLYLALLVNIPAGTVLGSAVMLLYYRLFHPNAGGCGGGGRPDPEA